MAAAPSNLSNEMAVERTVYDYAAALDGRDLPLLASVLADDVEVSVLAQDQETLGPLSLPPRQFTAAGIATQYARIFDGLAGTHHQITNVRVDTDGARATVAAHLQATHFRRGAPSPEYTVGGFYTLALERAESRWRLTRIHLVTAWERGDPEVLSDRLR
ncbi:nuclear transport factor 2 family protein [Microbacterium sp. NPDC055357]